MSEAPKRKPGRPSQGPRTSTAVRLKPELHEALAIAAAERDLSVNWLVNRAVEDFLARLIPIAEMRFTRDSLPTTTNSSQYEPPSANPQAATDP